MNFRFTCEFARIHPRNDELGHSKMPRLSEAKTLSDCGPGSIT